ncbi:hypothetical protein ACFE04_000384 [Oxalis oulophora]
MIHRAYNKLSRAAIIRVGSTYRPSLNSPPPPPLHRSPPLRFLHDRKNGPTVNPIATQMINYALTHARDQNSDESYAQGMLVLEQCLSTQSSDNQVSDNSKGLVLLAMSTLSYERGKVGEAIEKLQGVHDLKQSSLPIKVAALEALVGLNLQMGQDDTSSVLADKCVQLLEVSKSEAGEVCNGTISTRAKAVKGLVELVKGNIESGTGEILRSLFVVLRFSYVYVLNRGAFFPAESLFLRSHDHDDCTGSVALSYGEFLHATQNFSEAKEIYKKVIKGVTENKSCSDLSAISVCNMASEEARLAATLALGQLESHIGNFADAEKTLTDALTKMEQQFGERHPKIGAVLTCIALMYGRKAMVEHSSSLIVQEGLYRRALEILKAPPLETEAGEMKVDGRDIMALARVQRLPTQKSTNNLSVIEK